ncbi:MAG TPA: hypothetical protein VG820_07010 [Fimbriimonadaceae bacterium]|nr:hypothetical protein [Fimbriimonadaceae bacterium]
MIGGCGGSGSQTAAPTPLAITPQNPIMTPPPTLRSPVLGQYVVFGYNDLGMHCINEDFSELCVLPPANTLRAQVIDRSREDPRIVTSGVTLKYWFEGNTDSASKTNFWQYAPQLFGVNLPNNMGLFGFGLSGTMQATTAHDFIAQGIPLTQVTDSGQTDYYQLANVSVIKNNRTVAGTTPVVPVSWEMSCNECHNTQGISVATDILRKHDNLHGTDLEHHKPVLCASCHADPALGASGQTGVSTLSSAMHTAHATRMGDRTNEQICYSCHPGPQTQCLRDVHKANGMTCTDCHKSMQAVGNPSRRPWQDEPRCGGCHSVAGHEYEQPGVLYRDSVGHNGVKCITCHGSPHAIGPSLNPRDNVQPIRLQGHAGTIDTCTVCHNRRPDDPFNHTRSD